MMRFSIGLLTCLLFVESVPAAGPMQELPDAALPLAQVIDQEIDAGYRTRDVVPAARVDDLTLLRRTTLDLAGRVPTVAEMTEYESQSASERRERLIERLVNSPDYAYHLRNEWDAQLVPANQSTAEWREYLLMAARENRPWDVMFTDMMVAKDDDAERRGALQFLKSRERDLDDMTNSTSALFFGVSINCAKCHDHPLVLDWQQDHYFGLQSFFSRTYVTRSKRLAEKPWDEVKFTTTAGVEKTARFMFLTGDEVLEPVVERTSEQKKADNEEVKRQRDQADAPPPPEPAFSPRLALVKMALDSKNRSYFARNLINRTWARLMGRGLVHPVDQMHSSNTVSHPKLLDWLERDFIAHHYDVKRLIRGIVSSEAYARSSQWTQSGEPPAGDSFALMTVRPLTPKQLSLSLAVATSHPEQYQSMLNPATWAPTRGQLENQSNGIASLLEYPGEHFQVSVTEALLFSNSPRVQNEFLADRGDRLLAQLAKTDNDDTAIQLAYRSVLTRSADNEELRNFRDYLSARSDRRLEGLRQMVWALMTSPEFRFNY